MSNSPSAGSSADSSGGRLYLQHPPGYRRRRFRNWFFLGLLYAGYYLCRYNLGIVSPELKAEFGMNNEQYGWINSGRDGGYAIGQFVNGLFADGLGGKQSMAIGALGTIALNMLFGASSMAGLAGIGLLITLVAVRTVDGYIQAFGAPGMVKINTSWFQRRERGKFAGIFGGMIQLGAIGVGTLGKYLLVGFSIPLIGLVLAKQDWRSMFFVPPAILFVLLILMWLNVRNHPEETGYAIPHDDDAHAHNPRDALPIRTVFAKIASNPLAWINAGAYFCTGFVRRTIESWWVLYLLHVWQADKSSPQYLWLVWLLPISAFLGSFGSGLLSDTWFRGRRSPVAASLYGLETLCILAGVLLLGPNSGNAALACVILTLISLTCNSSHSIIGTAVAMDIGGRKMAGFACGVIDSFQYFGAILAGFALGKLIDQYHDYSVIFKAMLPFSLLGTALMLGVHLATRGRDVRGA